MNSLDKRMGLCLAIVLMANAPLFSQERPAPPQLVSPPDGAVIQYPVSEILFRWEPVQGATGYVINIIENGFPILSQSVSDSSLSLDLQFTPDDVGKTITWSVISVTGSLTSSRASIASFTLSTEGTPIPTATPVIIPTPLPPPRLIFPADGSDISPLDQFDITFFWQTVTGASAYQLTVYQDNEPLLQPVVTSPSFPNSFAQQIFDVFQWDVRSIDSLNQIGVPSQRFSFSIGKHVLPTPTPMQLDPDLNQNGRMDVNDLYLYAELFATNSPRVDFDHSGLNERNDLLFFLEQFIQP